MPRHAKVAELLTPAQTDELRTLARQPACTIDQIHQWLSAHGHKLSRHAAATWKRHFDHELRAQRLLRCNQLADVLQQTPAPGQVLAISSAAALQLIRSVYDQCTNPDGNARLDANTVLKLTHALQGLLRSQALAESLKALFDKARQALADADALAKNGGSGAAVAQTLQKAFGMLVS